MTSAGTPFSISAESETLSRSGFCSYGGGRSERRGGEGWGGGLNAGKARVRGGMGERRGERRGAGGGGGVRRPAPGCPPGPPGKREGVKNHELPEPGPGRGAPRHPPPLRVIPSEATRKARGLY